MAPGPPSRRGCTVIYYEHTHGGSSSRTGTARNFAGGGARSAWSGTRWFRRSTVARAGHWSCEARRGRRVMSMGTVALETLAVRRDSRVLFAEIAAPPMNLLGPELVRDLVSLIQRAEADDDRPGARLQERRCRLLHLPRRRDPDRRVPGGGREADRRSVARLLFRYLSASRLVTIAQIEGRVRGAGSEFALACDMRFAARESAIFGQFEPAFGLLPGGGRRTAPHAPHGPCPSARGHGVVAREDYDAELAELVRLVFNRALPIDSTASSGACLPAGSLGFRPSAEMR